MDSTMSKRIILFVKTCILTHIFSIFSCANAQDTQPINPLVKITNAIKNNPNAQIRLEDVWEGIHIILTQTSWWSVAIVFTRISIIILFTYIIIRIIDKIIEACRPKIIKNHPNKTHTSIVNTIIPIVRSILRWILIFIAILLLLSEMGINITPLIYSLSVVGLAFSIGSQDIIKNFLNGIMTIFEGSIAIGDKVIIGEYEGKIESMSLRYVHIRHEAGAMHTIPFSEVKTVTNISRDYTVVIISLVCTPRVCMETLENIFKKVYADLKSQKEWAKALSSPLKFLGIKRITVQGVEITAHIKIVYASSSELKYAFYNKLLPLCQEKKIPLVFNVSDSDVHTNQYIIH